MTQFWQSKRVLVTGGGGFLGSALVEKLNSYRVGSVFAPRKAEFDLRTEGGLAAAFDAATPDIVIHLAALVGGINANIKYPGQFFFENSLMNLLVIEEARKRGVKKLATVGSICAYPRRMSVPLREETMWDGYPEETNAPYGISKRMSWVQLDAYRKQYGFNGIYLIPASMYGPRDSFDLENSHVIPALIRKCIEAIDRGEKMITVWGSGNAKREFYYVEDAAEAILRATEIYNSGEPLNIGSGVESSIREVVEIVKEVTGFTGTVNWDVSRPDGEPRRLFDLTKASRLGIRSKTPLRRGIEATVRWYLSTLEAPAEPEIVAEA